MSDHPQAPNPGSAEAMERGCTCPVHDNHHGRGMEQRGDPRPLFWINDGCPIHNVPPAHHEDVRR